MKVSTYQNAVDEWIKSYGVRYFSELTNMAILVEEVGEVARLISRIYGEQSFKEAVAEEQKREMLSDELADVIWVVTCLANQTGIDLETALQKNIEKKTKRDQYRHIRNDKLK
ncbi:MAG: nucleotide pyrophosphohydrolase [Saprospiraceae bacterium]|nr:nucleotide pyrophosphohydrolase [Saprospiraceae bacterium]